MAQYVIDFDSSKTQISEVINNEMKYLASINTPKLSGEVSLPLSYDVTKDDGSLVGKINSYMPEKEKISFINDESNANLTRKPNNTFSLRASGKVFDVKKLTLDELLIQPKEMNTLKQRGFQYRYTLKNSKEGVSIDFYEKDQKARTYLCTGSSTYEAFLPLILRDKILETTKDIIVEQKERKRIQPIKKKVRVQKETDFIKFVKEHYSPEISEGEFPFIDDSNIGERFFEYMDSGLRPIILNGPTGNGKTVLGRHYASERKQPFYFDPGNSSFRLSQAIGKFTPTNGGATFTPGSLTLAAIFGGVYVLEETAQIPQDEFTGLNIFLETGQMPITTQFGHEVITADPNFKFVATGNFHQSYTTNTLNDAILQRFTQIKVPYPTRETTTEILLQRSGEIDYEDAELITDITFDMRKTAKEFHKDLGLKGSVDVAQRLGMGSTLSMEQLVEDNIVNPLITYENGEMKSKLMEVIKERF